MGRLKIRYRDGRQAEVHISFPAGLLSKTAEDWLFAAQKQDPEILGVWQDLQNRVLYSDEDLHILNKPARLVVQGAKRISMAALTKAGHRLAAGDDTK